MREGITNSDINCLNRMWLMRTTDNQNATSWTHWDSKLQSNGLYSTDLLCMLYCMVLHPHPTSNSPETTWHSLFSIIWLGIDMTFLALEFTFQCTDLPFLKISMLPNSSSLSIISYGLSNTLSKLSKHYEYASKYWHTRFSTSFSLASPSV